MIKEFTSLGLMSGTSGDGVDASIIQSNGDKKYKLLLDKYYQYDNEIYNDLHKAREKINNSEVVFLNGKKFGRKKDMLREIEQKKYINNLGSSIVNEDEFKIPTKIFLNDIIIHSIKNFLLFRIWKKNYCGNLSTEKILQIIHLEYVENKITSKYLDIKVFVSRDDYDSSHITRTLIQNLNGNLNIGIQHSAFSYPQILPLQAYNYFDIYEL